MTSRQKAAISRVVVDLIKADKVIDKREIEFFNKIKEEFAITPDNDKEAYNMTLADALTELRQLQSSEPDRFSRLMDFFEEMTVSDGFCSREEALLVMALRHCLRQDSSDQVISVKVDSVWVDDRQVLYVESEYYDDVNKEIADNLRLIHKEFGMCGLEFVYIPEIVDHYREMAREGLLNSVVKMLVPSLSDASEKKVIEKIEGLTTATFCIEQLHYKLDFSMLDFIGPALMVRIGQSRVGDEVFTNFLLLDLQTTDTLTAVRDFCDAFMALHSADSVNVSYRRDEHGRFLYTGFYRRFFEILTLHKSEVAKINFDFLNGRITFKTALKEDEIGIGPRERALYALIVSESNRGGINFTRLETATEEPLKKEAKRIQRKYEQFYRKFDKQGRTAPDILWNQNRNPLLTRIKNRISEHKGTIYNYESFIQINQNGRYYVQAPWGDFICTSLIGGGKIEQPIAEAEVFIS